MPFQVRLWSAGTVGAALLVVPACAALPTASRAQAQASRLPPGGESSRRPRAGLSFIATAMIELKFLTLNSMGFNTVVALGPQRRLVTFDWIAPRDAVGAASRASSYAQLCRVVRS